MPPVAPDRETGRWRCTINLLGIKVAVQSHLLVTRARQPPPSPFLSRSGDKHLNLTVTSTVGLCPPNPPQPRVAIIITVSGLTSRGHEFIGGAEKLTVDALGRDALQRQPADESPQKQFRSTQEDIRFMQGRVLCKPFGGNEAVAVMGLTQDVVLERVAIEGGGSDIGSLPSRTWAATACVSLLIVPWMKCVSRAGWSLGRLILGWKPTYD